MAKEGNSYRELQPQRYNAARLRLKYNRHFIILLAGLAALIIGVAMLIYYAAIYEPQQRRVEVDATAIARIEQVRASETAQAAATAQAQAEVTATAVATGQSRYDQVLESSPLFDDPLKTPELHNWATGQGCTFTDGTYHASEVSKGFFLPCSAQSTSFSNFMCQVQMTILKGDAGGLIFRSDLTFSRFYVFRVSRDGTYDMYYYANGTTGSSQKLVEGYSNLILTGTGKTNLVTVLAQGSIIDLYINGKYLAGITHNGPSAGLLGVIADSSLSPTEVVYSQARVWKL